MNSKMCSRRVRGISLIELMVSMTIGLVVVAAVIVSYLGSGKVSRYQAALSEMNQDAQIGLNLLSREFQLAGYSQPSSLTNINAANPAITPTWVVGYNLGTVTSPVFGCDGTGGAVPFVDPRAANVACGPAVTPTVSAFEVVYEADTRNTVPSSAGIPTDCLGQAIAPTGAGSATFYIAHNRYFINRSAAANASGRPELYCASDKAGGSQQPLMENVEDMQIWYGVQTVAGSRQVGRYVKAGKDLASTPFTINAAGAAEWANVISVRICLLMRSAEPVFNETIQAAGNEDTLTYQDCDSVTRTSTDRFMRRAYFTTSTLRSKMAF